MKTVLLTGASGFIGSHIAASFLKKDFKVIAPVRAGSAAIIENLKKSANFKAVNGNFYNPQLLETISGKVDAVVHFASIRGEGGGSADDYIRVNVDGTRVLLEFARKTGIEKFIYCSSVGVLGTIPVRQPAQADDPVCPDNLYHNSKWQSELLVNKYHGSQMHTCILRPTITYGPGDDGFIKKLVDLVAVKRFPLSSKEVFIHILDVKAFASFLCDLVTDNKVNGKTYIVADKSPVALSELVNYVANILGTVPGFMKIPSFVFSMAETGLKLINHKKLLTSMQLISKNWTYSIDDTVGDLAYKPSDTLRALNNYLEEKQNN